jgi:hypothetical protein
VLILALVKDRIALAMIEDAKERATKKVEPSLKLLQGIQELDSMVAAVKDIPY